jgi:hypothetical protein
MAQLGDFIDDHLSSVTFAEGRAGISSVRVIAVHDGFQRSARSNDTGDQSS